MKQYQERRTYLLYIFGSVCLIFIVRLFFLQVLSPDFAVKADQNVIKKIVLQPSRGIIYDRKGKIYVTNSPIFDLMFVPSELYIPDSSMFEQYLGIQPSVLRKLVIEAEKENKYKQYPLKRYIDADVYYLLQEHLWQCRGFYTIVRTSRNYLKPVGANFLGYINEVTKADISKSNGYYKQGDLIGTTGLERFYEPVLRGTKGVKMILADVNQREIGPFADGRYDTIPEKGTDIQITIDTELQLLGETLMQNKRGSIVAIEPSTGEILAFVSSPAYDPQMLIGLQFANNWFKLAKDTLKPLFNRPLMATYPPGSVFKIANALIALQEGTLFPGTVYGCARGFSRNPTGRPGCHAHPSPLNLTGAIQHSCNAYFAAVYVDYLHHPKFDSVSQAYEKWREYMTLFGIGHTVGIDMPGEKRGFIPEKKFYDKWYGRNRWKGMTIVSNSIGQGEVTMTPLQMANVAAIVANRGFYIQPHFFRRLYNSTENNPLDTNITFTKTVLPIKKEHFDLVADAMALVVTQGTGFMAKLDSITICGKTGTAENPHGEDHSVFFAFAPKDNPKIAIAVIVENAKWGGTWAAPIASMMIEKHITGWTDINSPKAKRLLEGAFVRDVRPVVVPPELLLKPGAQPEKQPLPSSQPGVMAPSAAGLDSITRQQRRTAVPQLMVPVQPAPAHAAPDSTPAGPATGQ